MPSSPRRSCRLPFPVTGPSTPGRTSAAMWSWPRSSRAPSSWPPASRPTSPRSRRTPSGSCWTRLVSCAHPPANLLRDPQPANFPLPRPFHRILPVVIGGGQFPVNPLTIRYVGEQLTAQGLPPPGPIQPLTVLDLEELEGCQALHQRRGMTLPSCSTPGGSRRMAAWPSGTILPTNMAVRKFAGPPEMQAALAESLEVIQRLLGASKFWSPPGEPNGKGPAPVA